MSRRWSWEHSEELNLRIARIPDRPSPFVDHADHSDLFICEGMYGEKDKEAKAREIYKHMTFYEGGQACEDRTGKEEMWLTHYSPSLTRPEEYMDGSGERYSRRQKPEKSKKIRGTGF